VALVSEPVVALVADLGLDPASVVEEVAVAYPSIGAAMQGVHVCREFRVSTEMFVKGVRQVRRVCVECGTDTGWRKARATDGPVAS